MKSVILFSLLACACAAPLAMIGSHSHPYMTGQSHSYYPTSYDQGLGYHHQYPNTVYPWIGVHHQSQLAHQYISTPVEALQLLHQIEQHLHHIQQHLEENQHVYEPSQWQEYMQVVAGYINEVQQLQVNIQTYVQEDQPIPSEHQSHIVQLQHQVDILNQEIHTVHQHQGVGYGQGVGHNPGYGFSFHLQKAFPFYQQHHYQYQSTIPGYPVGSGVHYQNSFQLTPPYHHYAHEDFHHYPTGEHVVV
ncbi:histidine-rich glycoprotein-like [Agrilus planipennis]|uniref:Histidine-rich glycoprotein-like n=1 Tax=Agrilus planipennis TaxID=224129 RepID=A0A1W4WL41_AGRPL|nr:histidine-rich glycoprotein-like [Agrilus planipennis]